MSIVTYPLNGIKYSAEDAATYNSTRTTGIYAGDDFSVTLTGADNTVTVGVGLAWMKISKFFGVAVAMKTETAVDMGLPDTNYPRIDALILRYDANTNATELTVKKGTAASSPKAPAVDRTEAVHEIHLYQVRREPSATAITAANVTDLRLSETYCGLMADAVTRVDTTAINAQVNALIQQLRESLADVEGQTYYASKGYVDAKHTYATATIPSSGWSSSAPYTQTVMVAGVLATDSPHVSPVYNSTLATAQAQKEAWSAVSKAEAADGSIKFYCFEDKPSVDIPIQVEVNR